MNPKQALDVSPVFKKFSALNGRRSRWEGFAPCFKVVEVQNQSRGTRDKMQTAPSRCARALRTREERERPSTARPQQPAPPSAARARDLRPALCAVTVHRSLGGPGLPRRPGHLGSSPNAQCVTSNFLLPSRQKDQHTSRRNDHSSDRRHPRWFNKWQRGPGAVPPGRGCVEGVGSQGARAVPGRGGPGGPGAGPRSLAGGRSPSPGLEPRGPAPSATQPPRSRGPATKTLAPTRAAKHQAGLPRL